jgi:hypothetical protein
MTSTVIVQVVDELGHGVWHGPTATGRDVGAHPAIEFRSEQSAPIMVTLGHGGPLLGELRYLERGFDSGDLIGVGVLEVEPEVVTELRCSAELRGGYEYGGDMLIARNIRLDAVALVGVTAGVGARPVRTWTGDYRSTFDRSCWPWAVRSNSVITRAVEARHADRRRLTIHEPSVLTPPPSARPRASMVSIEPRHTSRPNVAIEHSAPVGRVLDVR